MHFFQNEYGQQMLLLNEIKLKTLKSSVSPGGFESGMYGGSMVYLINASALVPKDNNFNNTCSDKSWNTQTISSTAIATK